MNTPAEKKSFTRFFPAIVRYVMGLPLLIFGLNGFLNFIPPPEGGISAEAMAFSNALLETGYMMPLIGLTQLVVGLMLVTNRFVPLALALFAPFIVNSVAFHIYLEPSGLVPACVFLFFELYLAWKFRHAYRPMLVAKTRPGSTS